MPPPSSGTQALTNCSAEPRLPVGLRVTHLRVDQVVQQVRLPPVVPGAEPAVTPGRGPGHHAQLGARHTPQRLQMSLRDGGFGAGRPVRPYLIPAWHPALPGTRYVTVLSDPGVHG